MRLFLDEPNRRFRWSEIRDALLSGTISEKINENSIDTILSRRLHRLESAEILHKDDQGHKNVCYSLVAPRVPREFEEEIKKRALRRLVDKSRLHEVSTEVLKDIWLGALLAWDQIEVSEEVTKDAWRMFYSDKIRLYETGMRSPRERYLYLLLNARTLLLNYMSRTEAKTFKVHILSPPNATSPILEKPLITDLMEITLLLKDQHTGPFTLMIHYDPDAIKQEDRGQIIQEEARALGLDFQDEKVQMDLKEFQSRWNAFMDDLALERKEERELRDRYAKMKEQRLRDRYDKMRKNAFKLIITEKGEEVWKPLIDRPVNDT